MQTFLIRNQPHAKLHRGHPIRRQGQDRTHTWHTGSHEHQCQEPERVEEERETWVPAEDHTCQADQTYEGWAHWLEKLWTVGKRCIRRCQFGRVLEDLSWSRCGQN